MLAFRIKPHHRLPNNFVCVKQWRIDSVDKSNHISWYLSLFIASARLVTISCWLLVFVSSNYICRTLWSYRFPFCETIIKLTLHTTHKHSGKKILEKIYNKSSTFCHIIWLFVERHETFSFTHRDLGDGGHITTRTHEQSHKKKKKKRVNNNNINNKCTTQCLCGNGWKTNRQTATLWASPCNSWH